MYVHTCVCVCVCVRGLGTRGWWVKGVWGWGGEGGGGGAHVPEVFIVSW